MDNDDNNISANNVIMFIQCICKVITITVWNTFKLLLPSIFVHRKSITGETVLITGAGSGIGRLLAQRFAKLGARLVLWDINENGNAETKKITENIGAEVFTYKVDLSKKDDIYQTAEQVKQTVGDINILINNAGVVFGRKFMDSSDENIQKTININALSHFFTTKAFLGAMMKVNHGHIVEIASMAGKCGVVSLTDYCASKHAVIGFASSLAAELRAMKLDGIYVTTICPFFVNTGMFEGVRTCVPLILPILSPEYVADSIIEAIVTNKEIVYLPRSCGLLLLLQCILPNETVHILEEYFGMNRFMENFVGRPISQQFS